MKKTKEQPKEEPNILTGRCFHVMKVDSNEVERQGRVIGTPHEGYFLVLYYDYMTGGPSYEGLVHISKMDCWRFYRNEEQMRTAYEEMRE